jgi:hypothetical protein
MLFFLASSLVRLGAVKQLRCSTTQMDKAKEEETASAANTVHDEEITDGNATLIFAAQHVSKHQKLMYESGLGGLSPSPLPNHAGSRAGLVLSRFLFNKNPCRAAMGLRLCGDLRYDFRQLTASTH